MNISDDKWGSINHNEQLTTANEKLAILTVLIVCFITREGLEDYLIIEIIADANKW